MKVLIFLILAFTIHSFAEESLNVGFHQNTINKRVPQKDLILGMTYFLKQLGQDEGIDIHVAYYDDPIKLMDDFKSGKINFAAAEPLTFVRHVPSSLLDKGIMGYPKDREALHTLLILSRTNDSRPLREKLRGVIATDGDKQRTMYLQTLMIKEGLGNIPFLLETPSNQQSILKLFFNKADLALVDLSSYRLATELNPQIKRDLSIVKSLPLTMGSVSYTRRDLSPSVRAAMVRGSLKLSATTKGKQMLSLFRSETAEECSLDELDSVRKLYERYQYLIENTPPKGKK